MSQLWVYDVYMQLCAAGWDRFDALRLARLTVEGHFN